MELTYRKNRPLRIARDRTPNEKRAIESPKKSSHSTLIKARPTIKQAPTV